MKTPNEQEVNHIIGCTRTIQTAVLVVAYLKTRWPNIKGRFEYRVKDPTPSNGYWSSDILVVKYGLGLEHESEIIGACRAFVAGRGEIWA